MPVPPISSHRDSEKQCKNYTAHSQAEKPESFRRCEVPAHNPIKRKQSLFSCSGELCPLQQVMFCPLSEAVYCINTLLEGEQAVNGIN